MPGTPPAPQLFRESRDLPRPRPRHIGNHHQAPARNALRAQQFQVSGDFGKIRHGHIVVLGQEG